MNERDESADAHEIPAAGPSAGVAGTGPGDIDIPADHEIGPLVRAAPILLLVVAACTMVALGATGFGLLAPPADPGPNWLVAIRGIGVVSVLAGIAGLRVQRRRATYEGRGRDPTVGALLGAGTLMTLLALLSLLAPSMPGNDGDAPPTMAAVDESAPPEPGERPTQSRASGTRRTPALPGGFGLGLSGERQRGVGQSVEIPVEQRDLSAATAAFRWIGRILLPILFVALVVGVWMITGRLGGLREEAAAGPPVAPESAEAGLQASLDELARPGLDPRSRITAAYRALLAALAAAGAPREPQEAPFEHLHRALGPLGVRPEPMHRLTELYIVAQFSDRPVTERDRIAAADALEAALASLRASIPSVVGAVVAPGEEAE